MNLLVQCSLVLVLLVRPVKFGADGIKRTTDMTPKTSHKVPQMDPDDINM